MADIGFIGLGNMGGPMVRNLMGAGHSVKAYDLSSEAVNFAVQSGAKAADTAADAATDVDFVVTMLPVGANVRDVYLYGGVIEAAGPNTILIDSSTIDVETSQAVHETAGLANIAMIDAPVSGGTMGADAGTLTFMCGGDLKTFQAARDVLAGMGKNIVYCGGPGMGQATKICNNMVAGVSLLAVAEAFVMGEKLGLDRQTLFDVMTTSSADCWALRNVCPLPGPVPTAPSANEFKPGFAVALMLKDLRLAQSAAQMADTSTPVGAAAAAVYALHANNGNAHLDMSSVIKLIQGEAD
jgi:3-hydroxyisobutyrate dehydrogenase